MIKHFCKIISLLFSLLAVGLSAETLRPLTNLSQLEYPNYFPFEVPFTDDFSAKPSTLESPAFLHFKKEDNGYKIWRLGGNEAEMGSRLTHPNGNGSITNQHGQHFYSRTNPTNNNETYILGSAGKQHAFAALWRISSKRLVAWVPTAVHETDEQQRQLLWDKRHSNVYWFTEKNRLYRVSLNFQTYKATKRLWDIFEGYESITFGLGEGDFSDDGARLVIVGRNRREGAQEDTIISYLVDERKRVASKVIRENRVDHERLDWAGVDPTGKYVVFNRPVTGNNMWVLPFDLMGEPRLLYKHQKHSDFVLDKEGEPWVVFGHWQGVFATKLSEPLLKQVWPVAVNVGNPNKYDAAVIDTPQHATASGHISRVADLAGVVLLSRNIDGGLYFVNIDRPEKIFYVGNTRHAGNADGETSSYMREPRGSASNSGKYIFFVSDYGKVGDMAYLNMIELSR